MEEYPAKVLVVGGAGYIGQVVSEKLLKEGCFVTAMDDLIHGNLDLSGLLAYPSFRFIKANVSDSKLLKELAHEFDSIIYLAAIVGEPACDQNPQSALIENLFKPMEMWNEVLSNNLPVRFIAVSTDSCYGQRPGEILTEDSDLRPLSLYAELKTNLERNILRSYAESKRNFAGVNGGSHATPVIMRLATVYGLAPRIRFDLAVNLLTREATLHKRARIFSGEQWRPLVHVKDVAKAFYLALKAPVDKVRGQVFNVGSNEQNIQFKTLGRIIKTVCPETTIEIVPGDPDLRDYHVNFDKISSVLGFSADIGLAEGIREIREAIESGLIADPYSRIYRNI